MAQMKDLKDLLKHEIQDLYSAEEQIIAALPKMIEKANNPQLKKALEDHLNVTETQLERLDQIKASFGDQEQKKGGIFGLFAGSQKCKGMEGLITEGEKVMGENMTPEVLDAAIIACAQKIEHYEICGYGTARAYARELELYEVAELLEETLDEEYEADDLLTDLAVGDINMEAEEGEEEYEEEEEGATVVASNTRGGSNSGRGSSGSSSRSNTSGSKSPAKGSSSRGSSDGRSSNGSGRGNTSSGKTAASKKTSSGRGGNTSGRSNSNGGGRSAGRGASSKGGAAKKSSKGR
jgi:ferritin-like metal-binding protein YciE